MLSGLCDGIVSIFRHYQSCVALGTLSGSLSEIWQKSCFAQPM